MNCTMHDLQTNNKIHTFHSIHYETNDAKVGLVICSSRILTRVETVGYGGGVDDVALADAALKVLIERARLEQVKRAAGTRLAALQLSCCCRCRVHDCWCCYFAETRSWISFDRTRQALPGRLVYLSVCSA